MKYYFYLYILNKPTRPKSKVPSKLEAYNFFEVDNITSGWVLSKFFLSSRVGEKNNFYVIPVFKKRMQSLIPF